MKSWLQENDIYMYSTHNEGTFLVAKDFLESLRTKFTNIWLQCQKNISIDKLDDIINKYNNTNHKSIKIKPIEAYGILLRK